MGLSRLPCFTVTLLLAGIVCSYGELGSRDVVSWDDFRIDKYKGSSNSNEGGGGRVIVVSNDGRRDSRTVQGAVDMIPDGNVERVKVFVFPGVYREKVVITQSKPYISLIGNDSAQTVISWNEKASDRGANGQEIGTYNSASVAVESDYFCATGITFENTAPSANPGEDGMQAVALRVTGDKAMFYRCRILGSQDTLFDHIGRHLFYECYIRGSIDFIFGSARSVYQSCTLNADARTYGAVAASQRDSAADDSGFSFLNCRLTGKGTIYLGRAWGKYATVVYSHCQLDGIVREERWYDWGDPSRRSTVTFGEYNCSGAGADTMGRAAWARSMTYNDAKPFLDLNYIDGNQWLRL